ncbi:MAG: hypothetical protein ACREH9_06325, partial [Pseudomonadota bacterium]
MLGPRVNSPRLNFFTGAGVAVIVMLSMILMLSVPFAGIERGSAAGGRHTADGLALAMPRRHVSRIGADMRSGRKRLRGNHGSHERCPRRSAAG